MEHSDKQMTVHGHTSYAKSSNKRVRHYKKVMFFFSFLNNNFGVQFENAGYERIEWRKDSGD